MTNNENDCYNLNDIESDKLERISIINAIDPYVDIIPYLLGFAFPIINYDGVFVQKDEAIIFVAPVKTYKDKDRIVGYTGQSSSVSMRLTKGVSYRTGGNRGKPIHGTHRDYNEGDSIITNKRVIFIGGKDNFEFTLARITAYKILSEDSFCIQSGKTLKNITVNKVLLSYVVGFIKYTITAYKDDISIYSAIMNSYSGMTSNQKKLCSAVKQKTFTNKRIRNNNKKNKMKVISIILIVMAFIYGVIGLTVLEYREFLAMSVFLFVLSIMFLLLSKIPKKQNYLKIMNKNIKKPFIIVFGILVAFSLFGILGSNIQNKGKGMKQASSVKRNELEREKKQSIQSLLTLASHPLVYDEFDNAKLFYENINDEKIKIIGSKERYLMEQKVKKIGEDPVLIYLTQDSTEENYIGTVRINLFDEEFCKDMDLEKAVKIITSYLPKNFLEVYKKDCSYMYEIDQVTIYTYAGRLNEKGVKYHNDGHP